MEKKIAAAYFHGAGAYNLSSFSRDIREAHQGYTMTLNRYVDNMGRLLLELQPFDPIYARVVWEKTFGGDRILTMHWELLGQVQEFRDALTEISFSEDHHVRDHRRAVEEVETMIRELTYYIRSLLRLGIQARGGDLSEFDD